MGSKHSRQPLAKRQKLNTCGCIGSHRIYTVRERQSSTSNALTFNMSLVSLPSCDSEVHNIPGRFAFLDGGVVLSLPMFYLQGVVSFPEAVLPIRVVQPRSLAAVDKAVNHVDTPCVIGVVRVHRHSNDGRHAISSVGTTAEIEQIKRLDDGSSVIITRGQQRFRLRRHWVDADKIQWGEVQIIEEDTPQKTPRDAFGQLAASYNFNHSSVTSLGISCFRQHDRVDSDLDWESLSSTSTSSEHSVTDARIYCSSNEDEDPIHEQSWQKHGSVKKAAALGNPIKQRNITDNDEPCFASPKSLAKRKKVAGQCRRYGAAYSSKLALQAPLSFWPRWAYEMYDSYSLARRAADLWRKIIVNPSMDGHVRKPDILSYHIASKLPMSGSVRQELLEIDGMSYRLQKEIQLLKAFNIIQCRNCMTLITKRSDGPVGDYVRQFDCGQEMMTVYNATGLALRGNPSKAHSLFPGYTWTIASCAACESNIGWLFRADKMNMLPKSFWGLRSSQISGDAHPITVPAGRG